jgi:hypothetical protein
MFRVPVPTLCVEGSDVDCPRTISMIMKQEAMSNGDRMKQHNVLEKVIKGNQQWVFGNDSDAEQPWGISG